MKEENGKLTLKELESNRRNAKKSTGPRTEAGKRRSSLNALKHGYDRGPNTMEDTMVLLGEDPEEFYAFRDGLIASRQPADAVERMLVEDIAMLAWKKRRLNRAQDGLQVRSLELLEFDRHRQALGVGRENPDVSQDEVFKSGLRRLAKSPAKFDEILSQLDTLSSLVAKQDFSLDIEPVIVMLYGQMPTLQGAQISNLYEKLGETGIETEIQQKLAAGLKVTIEEEKRDVIEEYVLYLQEHVHVSSAQHDSVLAPVHPQWGTIVRHEYALERLIERKLKLLNQIQRARRNQERAQQEAEKKVEK